MKLILMTSAVAVLFAIACPAQTAKPLPNPILYLIGQELHKDKESTSIRYRFGVDNSDAYPNTMFAAATELPPCGTNKKSARTWVDIYDQSGKRLNGFCALTSSAQLNSIWFALPPDVVPPSWVYVEFTDRQTGTKYKSNLAETTN